MLKIINNINELKQLTKVTRHSLGFVPTMGCLHEGHLELIRRSKAENEETIVSIFVNPIQFNNKNDFETYPNEMNSDLAKLKLMGVDYVFLPEAREIYKDDDTFIITEKIFSEGMCGDARPGHFDGVLTILMKLFHLIQPTRVYMGLKDYQQYKLTLEMVEKFFLKIEVIGVETVRESSGLALSSRNKNLTQEQKKIAEEYAKIFNLDIPLSEIKKRLSTLDLKIDYLEEKWGRKFIAVFIGSVRLIDNLPLSKLNETNLFKKKIFFKKNILFKITGSISAYKACFVISNLINKGHEVQVVASKDAFHFVGQATLEGLTGRPVMSELYETSRMMEHIYLNDWCDMTVLCPATANTLNKIANGFTDNLLTSLALATDSNKPYLIFPAMNPRMLNNKITQESIEKIETTGKKFFYGKVGRMACGHEGVGRLAEPEEIIEIIESYFHENSYKLSRNSLKILITAGGTKEAIDPVRHISNFSTGRTGVEIALDLSRQNSVTLLGSENVENQLKEKNFNLKFEKFVSFNELDQKLKNILSAEEFDIVIHLAAISDYTPSELMTNDKKIVLPTTEKISSCEDFSIKFKKNKKILTSLKDYSLNKKIKIFGFKLLRTDSEEKIKNEISKILNDSDYVVVNELNDITDDQHLFKIFSKEGFLIQGKSKRDLSQSLKKIISEVNL